MIQFKFRQGRQDFTNALIHGDNHLFIGSSFVWPATVTPERPTNTAFGLIMWALIRISEVPRAVRTNKTERLDGV